MKRVKSEAYLKFIRSLPCLLCGDNTSVEAAHIRFGDIRAGKRPTGMGEKPDDRWTLPLCKRHHDEQHKRGERLFWTQAGVSPMWVSLALQSVAPDLEAAENLMRAWR